MTQNKKEIIISKGKLHPIHDKYSIHDKCEDCFELGKEYQKEELREKIEGMKKQTSKFDSMNKKYNQALQDVLDLLK